MRSLRCEEVDGKKLSEWDQNRKTQWVGFHGGRRPEGNDIFKALFSFVFGDLVSLKEKDGGQF